MTDTETSPTKWIVGAIGAVIVGLLVVAVLVDFGSTEETGEPVVTGALPPMPNARIDESATGDPAPTVVGADFDGETVAIQNDGRAKAIVFLAHWCPHCQAEVPSVQAWLDQTGGVEGVDMYSVATDVNASRGNYPPSDWLESEGWTVPVILDDSRSSVLTAYGAGGFPFWVFTNSDGTVAFRVAGEIPIGDLERFMNLLS